MDIRLITEKDIPKWGKLSSEHDNYVKKYYLGYTEWTTDIKQTPTYKKYLESKVRNKEVYILEDISGNCLGIISFSKKTNSITFFGINQFEMNQNINIQIIGNILLSHIKNILDNEKKIHTKLIASGFNLIMQYRELFKENGFRETGLVLKNGVPFLTFVKDSGKQGV